MLLQEVQGSAEEQRNAVVSSARELANSGSAAACSGLMERQRRACSVLSAISGGAASTQPSTRVDSTIPVLACRSTSSPRGHHPREIEAGGVVIPTTDDQPESQQDRLSNTLDSHKRWSRKGGPVKGAPTCRRLVLPFGCGCPRSLVNRTLFDYRRHLEVPVRLLLVRVASPQHQCLSKRRAHDLRGERQPSIGEARGNRQRRVP